MNRHQRQIRRAYLLRLLAQGMLFLTLLMLSGVVVFILASGLPHVDTQLLFGDYGKYPSIKPALLGTLSLTVLALVIAAPIGIGTALFLTEYTRTRSPLIRAIRIASETLSGIPSIVYGIFGYLVFALALGFKYSLLGGGITLAIMILPLVVRSTEESLLAVPQSLREAGLALGASKVRMIFTIVLPCAMSGILTSLILAAGRVISESAVLILTIGMVVNKMPEGLMSPGTSLALDVYYFGSHGYPEQAAATGVVLLIVMICINLLAIFLGKVFGKGELMHG